MNTVDDIISQVQSLPPLPDTATKLFMIMNDPKSSVDEIVETVKYDQAITTEVLRLCNSAFIGLGRTVTSLKDAMLLLGSAKVLQMVMSVHANALLAREQAGYGLEPGALWRHSVAVALASSTFAQRLRLPNVSLAFTAGLLHDIGKVILNRYVADEFTEIVRRVSDEGLSFGEAEQQVLGFSHEEVGGIIAESWQLPDPIVRCIRYHHTPHLVDPPDDLVDTVYLATSLCLILGIGIGEDGLCYRADQDVMDRHALHEGDLEQQGMKILSELRDVEELFSAHAPRTGSANPACRSEQRQGP